MARRQSALTIRTDVSAAAATVLPGVSLPAWAYVPEPAPQPALEPMIEAAPAWVPDPEPAFAGVVAAPEPSYEAAPIAYQAPTALPAYPAPPAPLSYPVAAPVERARPVVADLPVGTAPPLTAFAPLPDAQWGPPAAHTAVATDVAPPAPTELPVDPTEGAVPPTDHHARVDSAAEEPKKGGSRRMLLFIGGLVVALLLAAFAAFVTPGFLVSSGDGSDTNSTAVSTPHVLLPPSQAGYTKVVSPAATAADTAASNALSAAGGTVVTAATYSMDASSQVTVAAGLLLSVPTADQKARLFTAWAASVGATGTTTVAVPGKTAQCGTQSGGTACVVIAGRKVTTLTIPGASLAQAAALVPTFAEFASVR